MHFNKIYVSEKNSFLDDKYHVKNFDRERDQRNLLRKEHKIES